MTGYSLHVGLNVVDTSSYIPAPAVLAGCVNDANDMERLAGGQGFRTRTMLDGAATSSALLSALGDMARATVAGDIALITFSGHGGQIGDTNGDEEDRLDETWCLYDRQVLDDELHRMWAQFPARVRIVVTSDSCHSGTVARSILAIATREALVRNPLGQEYWPEDVHLTKLRPRALAPSVAAADAVRRRDVYSAAQAVAGHTRSTDIAAEVILISGCQDNQLSSDGDVNGLFTEALLGVWGNGSFSGDYRAFHSTIVRRMPMDQVPNYYTVGNVSASFQAQRPFTITAPPLSVPVDPGGWGGGQGGGQTGTTRRTLRQGDSGEDVRYLQQKLVDGGAWLSIDGRFGPATANAVRAFQSRNGLTADGVVGPQTWAALEGGGSSGGGTGGGTSTGGGSGGGSGSWGGGGSGGWNGGWNEPTGGNQGEPSNQGGSSGGWGGEPSNQGGGGQGTQARPTLRRGDRGEHVQYLQKRLTDFGYVLTVDGQFGPGTESQVRSFQRSQGLAADGVVGPATWAALG
ncbi:peptidoglycan-binding protein [Tessaracoccus sp. Z1128]